jgi:hypothetical protein
LIFRLAVVGERVGVAGVVAALSVVSDLARGHPSGEAVRACLLATELGLGVDAARLRALGGPAGVGRLSGRERTARSARI